MPRNALRVLFALLMATAMWLYVQRVLIPYQKNQGPMRGSPRGNLSDLYPRWLGARELLLHGRDPYAADITREIQVGYYGRELDPARPGDPKDQQGFAYPVYVVFLLAPTIIMPFAVVHEFFFWTLAAITGASVLLWLGTLRWKSSPSTIVIWVLLTLSCFPAIQGLKLQQLTLLVAGLLAAAMHALARRRFILAGVLLALATIKPQLVFLLTVWMSIWVLGEWRKRQRVLWSFGMTVCCLVLAGEVVLPGWINEFRIGMRNYYNYTGGGLSVLDVMLSPLWGRLVAASLILMVGTFAWGDRRASENSAFFQWSLCLTLATTLLVIPMFAPYNQLLLVPGLMMVIRARRRIWSGSPISRALGVIVAVAVLWPFFAAAGLVIALGFLPGPTVERAWGLPFYPVFAIPIAIFAMLLASRKILIEDGASSHIGAEMARLAT